MKKKLAAAAALPLLVAASGATAQVLYEPFDYTGTTTNLSFASSPTRFNLQGTYWATRGTTATGNLRTSTENIPLPSYLAGANILPPSIGQTARFVTTGNAEYASLGLGEYVNQQGSNLYWSTYVKPNSHPSNTNGVMAAGLLSFTLPVAGSTPTTRQLTMWIKQSSPTAMQLGLGSNSSASADVVWSGDLNTTVSHFVVAKLAINGTGSTLDGLEMWIDPNANFGATTAAPSASAASYMSMTSLSDLTDSIPTTATGSPAHAGFFLRSGAAGGGNMHFDDIRVDSTWAGVTPNGNKYYTYTGAAGGGTIAGSTWTGPTAGVPGGAGHQGHVANLGNMGVAGTTINAGAAITTAGETLDTINIRNANPIIIDGSGMTIQSNASAGQIVAWSGGAHQVTAPITLASNLAVKADTDASLTFSGAITGSGRTVQKFGNGNVVLSTANIMGSGVSLDVRAGNIDFGGVAQQFDTLTLGIGHENISTGLGGPDLSPVTISNATTITANNYDLRSVTGAIAIPLSGGNVIKNRATNITLSASNNYTGSTIINAGTLNVSNNDNLGATPGGVDADNITIAGAASLRINATMTIPTTRGITMSGSFYNVNNPGIISVASGATVDYAGVISGTGGFTLTGNGPALMILSGNSTYAGPTNVVGAGVTLRIAADNALPTTTVLGLNGTTATFDMGDAANAGFDQTIGGIVTNGITPLITNTGTTIKTLTVNTAISNDVNFPIAGNLNLVKSGTGVVTLRGTDTYAGTTTINTGGAIVVGTTLASEAIPNYPANLTLNTGGGFGARLGSDSATSTGELDNIQTNAAVFNGADKHLAIEVTTAGPSATYSTPIANVGVNSRGLMKYGGGILELAASNSYSGNTMLKGGTLQVSSTDNLGDGSATNDIAVDATSTLKTTAGITTNRDVALNAGVLSFDATGDTTLTGVVSGAGALTKTGPGMLVLTSSNSYTGNTIVTGTASGAGILRVTNNNALGTTAGTTFIAGGSGNGVNAQLDLDGTAGNLTIAEPIIIEGKTASTLTPHIRNVAGNNTITGPLTMDAAGTWYTLQSDAGKLTVAGINNATNATGRAIKLRGAGNGEINGPIQNTTGTGVVTLEKFDSGTWTLSGNNTYTGFTTVNGGKLAFAAPYGTGGALTVADGAVAESTLGGNRTLRFTSLAFNTSGQLNINNNKLIVQFGTNASPLAATRAAIIAGRGGTDFGNATWQGTGGISSDAAAIGGFGDGTNPGDGISFAVGYVENSFLPSLGLSSYTEFGGQTVDSGSMLIRYTRGADCNLDGKVNTDDVTIVGATFGTTNAEWSYGDFDYDGVVDSDDVTVLGALYDATAPALSQAQLTAQFGGEFAAAFARGQAMAAVPEPTALSLLGLGGLAMLKRRRRQA